MVVGVEDGVDLEAGLLQRRPQHPKGHGPRLPHNQRNLGQLFGGDLFLSGPGVLGGHDHHQLVFIKKLPLKALEVLHRFHHGQLELALQQPLGQAFGTAALQFDADFRVEPLELGQVARQHVHRHGGRGPNLHPPPLEALQGLGGLHKPLQGLHRPAGLG